MSKPIVTAKKDDSARGLSALERTLEDSDMRHVSLVVMRIEDLPEVRIVYGLGIFELALERIRRAVEKIVRGRGACVRTGPTEYSLVLPNMYRREAQALLTAQLGRPECIEIDVRGEEILLVPEIAIDLIAPSESLRQCHLRLRGQLMEAIEYERARLAGMARNRKKLASRAPSVLQAA